MPPTTNADGIKPVFYKTPDGVERELRFTFGARKRIVDRFGMQLKDALDKYDTGALPELLYACMYDEHGKPPSNLSLESWLENPDSDQAPVMMASLMSAASQGRAEKNELEALIRAGMEREMEKLIGSISGLSPDSASISQTENSGFSQNGNSEHSATDTPNSENSTTTALG